MLQENVSDEGRSILQMLEKIPDACALMQGAHELAVDMSMNVLLGFQSHTNWPQSTALAASQAFYLLVNLWFCECTVDGAAGIHDAHRRQ